MPLFIDNCNLEAGEEEPRKSIFEVGENPRIFCGVATSVADAYDAETGLTEEVTELYFAHGSNCKCENLPEGEKEGNLSIYFKKGEWETFIINVAGFTIGVRD